MEYPVVLINGTKGKFSICRYFSHISNQLYKYNILYFKYDENLKLICDIRINNKDINNLEVFRKDVEYNEINLINYLCIRYNIDFIICQNNSLVKNSNVIACGLGTIEFHESQSVEYTLEKYLPNFIRCNIPLITCLQEKPITLKLLENCLFQNTPVFLSNFYHLKYINFDTGLKNRYSYINVIIALSLLAYINTIYNHKSKEIEEFKSLRYKTTTYQNYSVYLGIIPNKLPNLKNINFDITYSGIKKIKDNLTFYFDNAGSFKSSNLLIDWFNKNTQNKGTNFCIFSCPIDTNLIRTILPLTMINFETLYIADYGLIGRNFEDIFNNFDSYENFNFNIDLDSNSWTETIYETFSSFYNDKKFEYGRKRSSFQLNEYMGFEEIKFETDEEINSIKLPPTPNLVVDDLQSVIKWIFHITNQEQNKQYNVLITGDKLLCNDVLNLL